MPLTSKPVLSLKFAFLLLITSAFLPSLSAAQISPAAPPHRVVIRAGRVLDVRSGNMLSNQAIEIEGDKIVRVGSSTDTKIPSNTETIDLPNATVLPGLIDSHTHLTFDPKDLGYESLGISIPREALIGARNARVTLEAGFTTVRNVGAGGYSDIALRDAINDGDVPGPRILASGPPLGITGGHCDDNRLAPQYHAVELGVADGVDAVRHKVRENIKYSSDVIKICATGSRVERRPERLAVHPRGNESNRRGSASPRPQGCRPCARSGRRHMGWRRVWTDRARPLDERQPVAIEEERHLPCPDVVPDGLEPRTWQRNAPDYIVKRCNRSQPSDRPM
jgi:hypothetical protein